MHKKEKKKNIFDRKKNPQQFLFKKKLNLKAGLENMSPLYILSYVFHIFSDGLIEMNPFNPTH